MPGRQRDTSPARTDLSDSQERANREIEVTLATGPVTGGRGMIVLETERLLLRRLTADDAEFILRLLNEPSFLRFIGDRGVRTVDDAREYVLNGPVASYEQFGFGLYLATLKDSGTPIGMCGLLKRDALDDVDIGFAYLPEFWSKGFAIEAARAVMEHGKRDFGLQRIVAVTNPDNAGSIRVLEKLGMLFERMVRLSGESAEIRMYGTPP